MTLIELFEESVARFPNNTLLLQNLKGKYESSSYKEIHERVYKFAAGLMSIGLSPGDRVILMAEGRNDWVVSELSILYNGAVNVPLSIKLNEPDEIRFRFVHSESKMAIASKGQMHKILEVAKSVSAIEKIICLDEYSEDKDVINIDAVLKEGEKYLQTSFQEFQKRYQSVKKDSYANICYTSGTTADPKGIILTHRNYTANVEQLSSLYAIPEWYSTLLILPWDHSFAHTCGIYAKMKYGSSLASVQVGSTPMETLKNIPKNIKEIKPVFLLSVPALAKNFKKNIEKAIYEKGGITVKLFNHALKIAYKYNGYGWNRGKGLRKLYKPMYRLYDMILFKKIRGGFGGRLKFFVGGGALLDIELQRFFFAIGIPMFQGYGLTEAAPVISSNNFEKVKMGSSGTVAEGIELKICDEEGKTLSTGQKGEIVIRGENVMLGYWKNETATKETLRKGWLHTGDMGYLDEDGFLYVLGRFKSLLIADDGEKFSPEGIEEAFTEKSPFINQCMLYNNQKPYSVCLLVPNKEAIRKFIAYNPLSGEELIINLLKKIDEEINKFRKGGEYENMFPQRWLPASVAILSEEFTEENRLLNSTLKMVRPKITEKYSDLLEYLYTPEAKSISNSKNISSVQQLISQQ
ncbi:MAG: AMP-binding protein [Bacteroidales bacterium]|nr:AMP-binding protein [Bacteroidales bacterium]